MFTRNTQSNQMQVSIRKQNTVVHWAIIRDENVLNNIILTFIRHNC